MNEERWRLIEETFYGSLERPAAERYEYLDNACGGDDEIRREVVALLRADEHRTGFAGALSETIAAVNGLSETEAGPEEMTGRRIGPYRVTGLIGQGGMGVVYRAVRDDDEYHKEVAVKLLGQGLGGEYLRRRFRQERQILARLEHPNIVRLLDGGTTEDGRPYFVMECVDNSPPLDRFCREQQPTIKERLKLFRQVCDAVDYAHRHLIVHRDLKPGHILIAPGGTPKLLDFGIAKMLSSDSDDLTSASTMIRILTPEYASPEQVRGEPVTTASDVYSLGIILYELLTGVRPFKLEGRSIAEIERIVSTEAPEKPSDVAAVFAGGQKPAPRSAGLSGDLDNIVLTALRKEPGERYRSAGQLGDDIDRFASGRPVMARKQTWRYVASKFVIRHWMGIGAAAALGVAILVGLVAVTYQARQIDRRFQQVRKLSQMVVVDIHDQIAALPGSTEARLRLIRTAVEYLDSLAQVAESDHTLQLDLAKAYERVAAVQAYSYGARQHREALEIRRKALQIYEKLWRAEPNNAELAYKLADVHLDLAELENFLGDKSERNIRLAGSAADNAFKANPSDARHYDLVARIQLHLGAVEMEAARPHAALRHYRAAVQNATRFHTAHAGLDAKRVLASSLYRFSQALWDTGNFEDYFREMRQAVRLAEECVLHAEAARSDRVRLLYIRSAFGGRLGDWAKFHGVRPVEAVEQLQEVRVLAESVLKEDPSNAQARRHLVTAYRRLASVLQVSEPAKAEGWMRKAMTLFDSTGRGVRAPADEAAMYRSLAEVLIRRGRHRGAVEALRTAVDHQRRAAQMAVDQTDLRIELHDVHSEFGVLLLDTGNADGALKQFRASLAISEPQFRAAPSANSRRDVAMSYENLGKYWAAVGQWREACAWRRKSLEIWSRWSDNAPVTTFSQAREKQARDAVALCDRRVGSVRSLDSAGKRPPVPSL